ncbi:hypothetical protein N8I77_004146 [Diaporthe amygdali]|uniref:Phosphatidic acid phosphatase type 2/haloperoxidase domain-containing protein n=1 Tax=Phomopsis amygdali TaxID=1214568 RepID=A0AAD9SJA3_PHOAM|nr:hypothetical protein N8I77_004146 [Diaporthe amygdali]KAK2610741.1 hypothetical protein N8I77_004146 [Diaporthe amygdali]
MSSGEPNNGSVPLIPIQSRRQYSRVGYDLEHDPDDHDDRDRDHHQHDAYRDSDMRHQVDTSYPGPSYTPDINMARTHIAAQLRPRKRSTRSAITVVSSYVFDWIIIFVALGVAYYMGNHPPNKRPFFLEDPNISFPFTEHETVPPWLLVTCMGAIPIAVVLIVSLIFVPGNTVPKGTPKSLIWKRKLWELHVGWLGLALSLASAWFITNGMKNLFGKPRPDLLSRCNPDIENFTKYIVGGENVADGFQRLVSAEICRGMDNRDDAQELLEDGFRSYPSGHSSSAAAGLIYLSLFIASKFAITFPFLAPAPAGQANPAATFSAFPSRHPGARRLQATLEQESLHAQTHDPAASDLFARHNKRLASVRQQAAAPPLYLLIFASAPFFTAIFIASSRWFDFRHHGFDILFGFLIGLVCAFFAFRWYHLPISQGAGWAWGPRCSDKAFWAGVGSFSYAMDWEDFSQEAPPVDEEAALGGVGDKDRSMASTGNGLRGGEDGEEAARRRAQ